MRSVMVILIGLVPLIPSYTQGEKVDFEHFARPYFVKNDAKLPANPAFLVIQDKKAFDEIFGVGFVMGQKPNLVGEKLFENHFVVAVIKSGRTAWKYDVQKVHVDKHKLIVEYSAKGDESATAKFTSPLILAVPRGAYREVVFIENGKEAGKSKVEQ